MAAVSEPDNNKKKPEDNTDAIEDAVIIEDEQKTPEADTETDIVEADEVGEDVEDHDGPTPVEPTDSFPDDPLEMIDPKAEDEIIEDGIKDVEEPTIKAGAEPTVAEAEPQVIRQGGFVPMVLGGIVAAGLGFGASQFLYPNGIGGVDQSGAVADLTATVQQQGATIARLGKELDSVKGASDTAGTEKLAGLVEAANGSIAKLSAKVGALETRLSALEKRPVDAGAGAGAEAAKAYEREVEALRAAMEKQKAEIAALVNAAQEEKASAEMTAKQAMIRTAVSRIQVALDTGKEFAQAIADLRAAGVSVPAILAETSETGVPTLADLSASFPEAARKALSVARKDEGTGGKVWTFVRNQLGMRSLEPKEGTDADAILSRAEAALNDSRLGDALAELQDLPELARVELTDWMSLAARRADAVAAAETLNASVASK